MRTFSQQADWALEQPGHTGAGVLASCWYLSPHTGWQPSLPYAFTCPVLGGCQPSVSGPVFFIGQSYSTLGAEQTHLTPLDVQRDQAIRGVGETLRAAQAFPCSRRCDSSNKC